MLVIESFIPCSLKLLGKPSLFKLRSLRKTSVMLYDSSSPKSTFLPHITSPSSMAPTRRYLRITKYSVLEVRIYLDEPSQQQSWLLRSNDPALPRVIEAVRPLVLPKLREENERAKGKKGGKGRGVKDVVLGGGSFQLGLYSGMGARRIDGSG